MKKELLQHIEFIKQNMPHLVSYKLSLVNSGKRLLFKSRLHNDVLNKNTHNEALLSVLYSILESREISFHIVDPNTYEFYFDSCAQKINTNNLLYRSIFYIINDFILLFLHYKDELSDKKIKIPKLSQIKNKLSRTMEDYMSFDMYVTYMRAKGIDMGIVNSLFIEEMQDMFVMLYKYIMQYCDNNMRLLDHNNISHVYNVAYLLDAAINSFVASKVNDDAQPLL